VLSYISIVILFPIDTYVSSLWSLLFAFYHQNLYVFLFQRKQKIQGYTLSGTSITPTSEFFTVALFLLMLGSQKLQILGGL